MPDRLLITKGEVAERLSVSVRTIERLVSTGRLPQVYVEHSARFRVKDLEAYVNSLTETQSGPVNVRGSNGGPLAPDYCLAVLAWRPQSYDPHPARSAVELQRAEAHHHLMHNA